ncbi:MAG: hypothetical protein H0W99_11975 [Acidobacteria bacterium]|nr:hypothetical protein [Acidobacteriota bacterium]
MNQSRNSRATFGMIILVPMLALFLVADSLASSAGPMPLCPANASCAKQKAILRQLERTRPTRKLTRKKIFNRIKAACDEMRSLDCPGIRNYQPSICFTDY